VEVRRPDTPRWETVVCLLGFSAAVLALRVTMPGHAARWIVVAFVGVLFVVGWRGQVRQNAARRAALADLLSRAPGLSPDERAVAYERVRRALGGELLPSMRRARDELRAMPGGLGPARAPEGPPRRSPRRP
jgi:hypothetical protein